MRDSSNLRAAKEKGDDEFYTLYEDIEKELVNYKEKLKDKIIHLNCDDYRISNFYKYLKKEFKEYGLKELHATHYNIDKKGAHHCCFNGEKETVEKLQGDGSYNSDEVLEITDKCDVVISNPPFSIYRHYFDLLIEKEKDFILIANHLSLFYNNVFKAFQERKIFFGVNIKSMTFDRPDGTKKAVNACWFTSFDVKKTPFFYTGLNYDSSVYDFIDNTKILSIMKAKDIPDDYYDEMAVPVSFCHKVNRKQFDILYTNSDMSYKDKDLFRRLIIKRRKEEKE